MKKTKEEKLEMFELSTSLLSKSISRGIDDYKDLINSFPYVTVIANLKVPISKTEPAFLDFNTQMTDYLGYSREELGRLSSLQFYLKHSELKTIRKNANNGIKCYQKMDPYLVTHWLQIGKVKNKREYLNLVGATIVQGTFKENAVFIILPENELDIIDINPLSFFSRIDFMVINYKKFKRLSHKERTVLGLISSGLDSKDILDRLFISRHTLESHRKNIRKKLETGNIIQEVRYGFEFRLIDEY